ncbi:hypothetical protein Vspart_04178 [Vibrio spartinae]|uniref:Uncharacterized protein n=1 Tax=Vibrio spartinae TaxID=1918945 RepID=A0A1N6LZY0_9VIBR|nr:hypothetical protein Vspart_04178 [Vibrio spartinae]SIO92677.1 hypothetical protein VSP9026_00295 [Vibrio spartinae]
MPCQNLSFTTKIVIYQNVTQHRFLMNRFGVLLTTALSIDQKTDFFDLLVNLFNEVTR